MQIVLILDLRWNSVGLLGGRAILEMLKTNKTICRLELAGNNIPGDVLKSIGKNVLGFRKLKLNKYLLIQCKTA